MSRLGDTSGLRPKVELVHTSPNITSEEADVTNKNPTGASRASRSRIKKIALVTPVLLALAGAGLVLRILVHKGRPRSNIPGSITGVGKIDSVPCCQASGGRSPTHRPYNQGSPQLELATQDTEAQEYLSWSALSSPSLQRPEPSGKPSTSIAVTGAHERLSSTSPPSSSLQSVDSGEEIQIPEPSGEALRNNEFPVEETGANEHLSPTSPPSSSLQSADSDGEFSLVTARLQSVESVEEFQLSEPSGEALRNNEFPVEETGANEHLSPTSPPSSSLQSADSDGEFSLVTARLQSVDSVEEFSESSPLQDPEAQSLPRLLPGSRLSRSQSPVNSPLNSPPSRSRRSSVSEDKQSSEPVPSSASEPSEDWGLPTMEKFEQSLSRREKIGKLRLARLLTSLDTSDLPPGPEAEDVLRAVARQATPEKKGALLGQTVVLTNIARYGEPERYSTVHRKYKVLRLLGEGSFKVVVEIEDEASKKRFALAIFFRICSRKKIPEEKYLKLLTDMIRGEESRIKAVCKGELPCRVGNRKGWSFPMFTATLVGVTDMIAGDYTYVSGTVAMMERLRGDMCDLMKEVHIPMESKLYVCKRLLLTVLHLQEAKFTHNDVKTENLLLSDDGSVLLADFGTLLPFGKSLPNGEGVTLNYAAPVLLLELHRGWDTGNPVYPIPKDDMWSLGVALYVIFTDGHWPYHVDYILDANAEARREFMEELLRSSGGPETLLPALEKAEVPEAWQKLIYRLLEPDEEARIDAKDVALKFRELIDATPE